QDSPAYFDVGEPGWTPAHLLFKSHNLAAGGFFHERFDPLQARVVVPVAYSFIRTHDRFPVFLFIFTLQRPTGVALDVSRKTRRRAHDRCARDFTWIGRRMVGSTHSPNLSL